MNGKNQESQSTLDIGLCSYENCRYEQPNSKEMVIEREVLEKIHQELKDLVIFYDPVKLIRVKNKFGDLISYKS